MMLRVTVHGSSRRGEMILVVVCYGVNDILIGFSEEKIKEDLTTVVDKLKECRKKTVLQTTPPFDYKGEKIGL